MGDIQKVFAVYFLVGTGMRKNFGELATL